MRPTWYNHSQNIMNDMNLGLNNMEWQNMQITNVKMSTTFFMFKISTNYCGWKRWWMQFIHIIDVQEEPCLLKHLKRRGMRKHLQLHRFVYRDALYMQWYLMKTITNLMKKIPNVCSSDIVNAPKAYGLMCIKIKNSIKIKMLCLWRIVWVLGIILKYVQTKNWNPYNDYDRQIFQITLIY